MGAVGARVRGIARAHVRRREWQLRRSTSFPPSLLPSLLPSFPPSFPPSSPPPATPGTTRVVPVPQVPPATTSAPRPKRATPAQPGSRKAPASNDTPPAAQALRGKRPEVIAHAANDAPRRPSVLPRHDPRVRKRGVERVALDDHVDPRAQLVGARLEAGRERGRDDVAKLGEVSALQAAGRERGRADA